MESILTGMAVWLITQLTKEVNKKLNVNVDSRIIVVILSLIAGSIYYYMNRYYPDVVAQTTEFVTGAFVTSQSMYVFLDNMLKKWDEKK